MRVLLLLLAIACGAAAAPAQEAPPLAGDPVIEARLQKLAEELRCLVCQNESLAGSRADLAIDLKNEIRAQMKAGKSDRAILDYLTARYGDFVLYRPPLRATTVALWGGPFLLLIIGAWFLLRQVQGRRAAAQRAPAVDAEALARAEAMLLGSSERVANADADARARTATLSSSSERTRS